MDQNKPEDRTSKQEQSDVGLDDNTIALDQSAGVRKRAPRSRVNFRDVARAGFVSRLTVKPDEPFSPADLDVIMGRLPSIAEPSSTKAMLQEIGGSYIRQGKQPQPLRSEARKQLQDLVDRTLGEDAIEPPSVVELRRMVNTNDQASIAFYAEILNIGAATDAVGYLRSDHVDPEVIGHAAKGALARLPKGGDYSDPTFHLAVEQLLEVYVKSTGRKVTWSPKPVGAATAKGTRRHSGGSPSTRFVISFFERLAIAEDENVRQLAIDEVTISNAVKRFRRLRPDLANGTIFAPCQSCPVFEDK